MRGRSRWQLGGCTVFFSSGGSPERVIVYLDLLEVLVCRGGAGRLETPARLGASPFYELPGELEGLRTFAEVHLDVVADLFGGLDVAEEGYERRN